MDSPEINNWYIKYGSTTLWGKFKAGDKGFSIQENPDKYAGWRLSSLSFWCVKGREEKFVIVKKEGGNDDQYGVLFGGKRFKDNTGYYDNGWHQGTPPPTTTNTKQKRRTRR